MTEWCRMQRRSTSGLTRKRERISSRQLRRLKMKDPMLLSNKLSIAWKVCLRTRWLRREPTWTSRFRTRTSALLVRREKEKPPGSRIKMNKTSLRSPWLITTRNFRPTARFSDASETKKKRTWNIDIMHLEMYYKKGLVQTNNYWSYKCFH